MNVQYRRFTFSLLVLIACVMVIPATCRAQLLPPEDFNGKSFEQWGLDWSEWAVPLVFPEGVVPVDPSRPDTVNGVRYLPIGGPPIGNFNLTIQPGTALFGAAFGFFGEQYDDGHSDDPADPLFDTILEQATVRSTLDGVVLFEGTASSLSARQFGPSYFPEPIPYTEPQQRGPDGSPSGQGLFAIASAWTQGIGTMYAALPRGEHTLRHEYNSEFLGGAFSYTYHISVVPEPATLVLVGILSLLGWAASARGRFRHGQTTV
jgi:hypothetical protein